MAGRQRGSGSTVCNLAEDEGQRVAEGGGRLRVSAEVAQRMADAGVDADSIQGVSDLASLPVLSKDDLPDLQAASPPFGGMLAVPVRELTRIFTSPGPILDPQGSGEDFWRVAPALRAAGFGPGQVVLNTFSYHLTPGGLMLDAGARAAGCVVIPGGVGNSAAQVELANATLTQFDIPPEMTPSTVLKELLQVSQPVRHGRISQEVLKDARHGLSVLHCIALLY